MTKKVKTAVIGCGAISATYIPNLKELFSVIDLCAVCDLNPQSANSRAEQYGIPRVMTLEEIEQSDEIEMVINLTTPGAHYDVTKRMLLAGKHVYSEKTLSNDVAQGKELVELARKKNLYLGVSPDTVLGAGIQTAKKLLDSGMIGRPTSAAAVISRDQALNSEVFPFIQKNEAGCFPLDVGVYYVAAVLSLLGPVESVAGFSQKAPIHQKVLLDQPWPASWEMPGNDLMAGSLKFQNGALGTLLFDGCSINTMEHLLILYGTEGILKLGMADSFNGKVTLIRKETGECEIPFTHGFTGAFQNPEAAGRLGVRGVGAAEMAWAIRQGRKNRLSGEFGLHTLEVLRGIEQSAREGTSVSIESTFEMKPLKSGYMDMLFGMMPIPAEASLADGE
jgi:predicted dehydrogenase